MPIVPHIFDSFWMGGFEAACHINAAGIRLDMIAATQHDVQVAHDYARLRAMGIRTIRDAVRWPLVEATGELDFSSLTPMVTAAAEQDMQVIWTLCHYGWPDDVDVFSPAFPDRFANFAGAVARFIKAHTTRPPFYIPINEVSFLAWAAGEVGCFHPFGQGRGTDLKRNLIRATIAACDAIWSEDRRARIVQVDPLIHVVPPLEHPELAGIAAAHRASQFDASDMLVGLRDPELGGHPRYLDVMGVNFYHSNQWEYSQGRLRWEDAPRNPRWTPFHELVREVFDRYRRPIFIAETSHVGIGRGAWIREMAAELCEAHGEGVPLEGICLFPVIDRMDWDDPTHWHNSGLWDLRERADGTLERVLNEQYAVDMTQAQDLLARC